MLMVYKTREHQAAKIQAVTHAGGTGRLQTVRREWNPLYYRVIDLFEEATGVPITIISVGPDRKQTILRQASVI